MDQKWIVTVTCMTIGTDHQIAGSYIFSKDITSRDNVNVLCCHSSDFHFVWNIIQINIISFCFDTVHICVHSVFRCTQTAIDLCFQMSAADHGICRFTGQITVNSDLYSTVFFLSVDFIHNKISVIFEINIICACFDFWNTDTEWIIRCSDVAIRCGQICSFCFNCRSFSRNIFQISIYPDRNISGSVTAVDVVYGKIRRWCKRNISFCFYFNSSTNFNRESMVFFSYFTVGSDIKISTGDNRCSFLFRFLLSLFVCSFCFLKFFLSFS